MTRAATIADRAATGRIRTAVGMAAVSGAAAIGVIVKVNQPATRIGIAHGVITPSGRLAVTIRVPAAVNATAAVETVVTIHLAATGSDGTGPAALGAGKPAAGVRTVTIVAEPVRAVMIGQVMAATVVIGAVAPPGATARGVSTTAPVGRTAGPGTTRVDHVGSTATPAAVAVSERIAQPAVMTGGVRLIRAVTGVSIGLAGMTGLLARSETATGSRAGDMTATAETSGGSGRPLLAVATITGPTSIGAAEANLARDLVKNVGMTEAGVTRRPGGLIAGRRTNETDAMTGSPDSTGTAAATGADLTGTTGHRSTQRGRLTMPRFPRKPQPPWRRLRCRRRLRRHRSCRTTYSPVTWTRRCGPS